MFVELGLVGESHELPAEPVVGHLDFDVDVLARERAREIRLDGVVRLLPEHLGDPPADQIIGFEPEPGRVGPVHELEASGPGRSTRSGPVRCR
jgi:hypothetical protein